MCPGPTLGRTVSWIAIRRDRATVRAGGHHFDSMAAGGAFAEEHGRADGDARFLEDHDEAGDFLATIKGLGASRSPG